MLEAAGANDGVRCPCPALEPYPPGWLTLAQDEMAQDLVRYFDGRLNEARTDVWVPYKPALMANYLRISFRPALPTFETAFETGCWVELSPLGA